MTRRKQREVKTGNIKSSGKEARVNRAKKTTESAVIVDNSVKSNELKAMNKRQQEYMDAIATKNIVITTGYAGTSKTYLACSMACEMFKRKEIDEIIFSRPAISNSKSLGFFKGSMEEKIGYWLIPVMSVLKERLGSLKVNEMILNEQIKFIPMETIKGLSLKEKSFFIVDEGSDLTLPELKSVLTRSGGGKIVICGDISQSYLSDKCGISQLLPVLKRNKEAQKYISVIDFDSVDHIVRSKECKAVIKMFHELEQGGDL